MRFRRLQVALFPELARFQSTRQLGYARAVAHQAVMRRPAVWIGFPIILIVAMWASSLKGEIRGALLILDALAYIALVWASRKTVQRALREQLVDYGIPICINCGYDLRGSKDRCPECGQEFETT